MKTILVCRESDPRETRVAMIPDDIKKLIGMGFSCIAHVACHALITWLSCTDHVAIMH